MKTNKVFMAFGKVAETKDVPAFKRYIGVAPVTILAINPTKERLEEIYGNTVAKEPEYLGTFDRNGKKVPFVRIDFIVKTVADKCNGIDVISKASFLISKEFNIGSKTGKIQVIDKYARTVWASEEEYKNHSIPMYDNGPARIDSGYRAVYRGEEDLINFVKNYLGIKDVEEYVDGRYQMREKPEDSEAYFTDIDKWFTGDIKEVTDSIALMPNNMIKVDFAIRHSDDGRDFQTIYTGYTMKYNSTSTRKLEKKINEQKAAGMHANMEFSVEPIHEFNPEPTTFTAEAAPAVNPFGANPVDDLPFGNDDPFKM